MARKKKEERVFFIDLLRVIAIFLVVFFHVAYESTYDNALRPIGFVGISLFFIISGFVLAKKYGDRESFSIKWLFKRYAKIAPLYYLAIIVIVVLFGMQTYSGELFKNVLLHFAFLDPFFKTTAYGIISPAWFLTPLLGLYILYPYLNRFVKKTMLFVVLAFIIMIVVRYMDKSLTSFSPLFFIGEFCFGIAFAYGKKNLAFIISALTLFVQPVMFLSYIIFYLFSFIKKGNIIPSVFAFLGENTLAIFLFHEAFMKVCFDKWHVGSMSWIGGLIVLSILTVFAVYLSKRIQRVIYRWSILNERTTKSK